jgi:hypothetical protein
MRKLFAVCALVALSAVPVAATTFVRMTDEALVDASPVAAVVRVEAREAAPGGQAATDYRVRVEEVLKGQAAEQLTVRVPGGGSGPVRLKIYGAPSFRPGERALVLIEQGADGTWRIPHLFLGAFHEVKAGEGRLAVRNLSEVSEARVVAPGEMTVGDPEREPVRDFDAFSRWIAARARGAGVAPDYLVAGGAAEGLRRAVEPFTLFEDPDDLLNMRWFEFDTSGNVKWRAHSTGQQGLSGGGYSEFQTALQAWNAEPQTPVDFRYQGTTGSTSGFDEDDGINTILFNDPTNLLPSFNCNSGSGVLAIGGTWYDFRTTANFQGKSYHTIVEADILINRGLTCYFNSTPNASKAAQQLFGHELGHTLGIGHSCGDSDGPDPNCNNAVFNDALMRAFIHDDSRGAKLNSDDRNALRALYQQNTTSPPAAPSGLTANPTSTTTIALAWNDNSSNETDFRLEARTLGGTFQEVLGTIPANATSAEFTGTTATTYVFRLRARNDDGHSAYSNQATATTHGPTTACVADATTLCLNGNRFKVTVGWKAPSVGTGSGPGQVAPGGTDDSGLLWFFDDQNLEMLVKALNGCATNNRYWVFFAATTNVEYLVTVIDSHTGLAKQYFNAAGTAAVSVNDTQAFVCQ